MMQIQEPELNIKLEVEELESPSMEESCYLSFADIKVEVKEEPVPVHESDSEERMEPEPDVVLNPEMRYDSVPVQESVTSISTLGTKKKGETCNICNRTFKLHGNLLAHYSVHSEKKTHSCDQCDKTFKWKNQLKRHKVVHTGEYPYSCNICAMKFTYQANLARHKERHRRSMSKMFACDICNKFFPRKNELSTHMNQHVEKGLLKCSICDKRFKDENDLKVHITVHTSTYNCTCKICGIRFGQRIPLQRHMKSHVKEKPLACPTCGATFTDKKSLVGHLFMHSGLKPHICKICGASFTISKTLVRHVEDMHSEGIQTADILQVENKEQKKSSRVSRSLKKRKLPGGTMVKFGSESTSDVQVNDEMIPRDASQQTQKFHQAVVNEISNDEVQSSGDIKNRNEELKQIIKKSTWNKQSQKIGGNKTQNEVSQVDINRTANSRLGGGVHHNTHSDQKEVIDNRIQKRNSQQIYVWKTWGNLTEQSDEETEVLQETQESNKSQSDYQLRNDFKQELEGNDNMEVPEEDSVEQNNEKPRKTPNKKKLPVIRKDSQLACSKCGKTFRTQNGLTRHAGIHVVHYCEVCSKLCSSKGNLIKHMRVHSEVRQFKCNDCGREFRWKSDLQAHTRLHTGEKPYKCHICNRAFTQQNNMVKHLRMHTGEKPYVCRQCGKRYTDKTSLNYHMKHRSQQCQAATATVQECKPLEKPSSVGSTNQMEVFNEKNALSSYTCEEKPPPAVGSTNRTEVLNEKSDLACKEKPSSAVESTNQKGVHKCDKCGKTFENKEAMQKHTCILSKVQKYSCEMCSKLFVQKGKLERHKMLVHQKEESHSSSSVVSENKTVHNVQKRKSRLRKSVASSGTRKSSRQTNITIRKQELIEATRGRNRFQSTSLHIKEQDQISRQGMCARNSDTKVSLSKRRKGNHPLEKDIKEEQKAQIATAKWAQTATAERTQTTSAERTRITTSEEARTATAEQAQTATAKQTQIATAELARIATAERVQATTAEQAQEYSKNVPKENAQNMNKPIAKNVMLQETLSIQKRAYDKFALFGKHVGIQLGQLPLQTAMRVQGEIQEILQREQRNTLLQSPMSSADISLTSLLSLTASPSYSSFLGVIGASRYSLDKNPH